MKFTLSWLKQHLDTEENINTILRKLTDIGLEVENSYNPAEILDGFVAAKIISTRPHPDADRLQLCLVDTGTEEIEIVCGAKNAVKGLTIIWPADFAWTHKGIVSPDQEKWIATGWFKYA